MTQTTPANPERTSRSPYVGAVAFFLLLIVIGVVALLPKLRHRDDRPTGPTKEPMNLESHPTRKTIGVRRGPMINHLTKA